MMNVVTFPREKARSVDVGEEACRNVSIYLEFGRLFYLPTRNNQKSYRGRWTCVTAYGFCADGGRNHPTAVKMGAPSGKRVRGSQQSEGSELRNKVLGKTSSLQRSLNQSSDLSHCWERVTPSWGPVTLTVSGGLSRPWDSSEGPDPLCLSYHGGPSSAASPHTCFSENILAVYLQRP